MERSIDHLIKDFDASAPLPEAHTIPGSWYTEPKISDM